MWTADDIVGVRDYTCHFCRRILSNVKHMPNMFSSVFIGTKSNRAA
jgi:hypothetical protein